MCVGVLVRRSVFYSLSACYCLHVNLMGSKADALVSFQGEALLLLENPAPFSEYRIV